MANSALTADEASAPTWVVVEQKHRERFACRLAKRARAGAAAIRSLVMLLGSAARAMLLVDELHDEP